jgi:AcrR family transcriptional regulator
MVDRRKRKTQDIIINSFYKLLEQKSFDKITVNQITELADINRGTFYLHYQDKYDLLEKMIQIYTQPMIQFCFDNQNSKDNQSLYLSLEYLKNHYHYLEPLLRTEGYSVFQNELTSAVTLVIERMGLIKGQDVRLTIRKKAIISLILGIIEWWLLEDKVNSSPADVAKELWDIINSILNGSACNGSA